MAETTNSKPGRKRKRTVSSDPNAPKYPDIPGVPMDVIPLFVHSLKTSTKYFQHVSSSCKAPYSNSDKTETGNEDTTAATLGTTDSTTTSLTVINNLMDRIQATADSTRSNEELILRQQQQQDLQTRMESAIEAWLEMVKRYSRNDNRAREEQQKQESTLTCTEGNNNDTSTSNSKRNPSSKSDRPSVALSCFLYAWRLQLEHGRVAPRRASLHLCGLLLEKSRDCRFHLAQDENLDTWIAALTCTPDTAWKNLEQAKQQLPYWQREAEMLLSFLVEQRGYGTLYPKLGVAHKRLRQLLPNIFTTTNPNNISDASHNSGSNSGNMIDWRQSRDIALKNGPKEIKRVEKLIERVYGCFDVLVPRVGSEYHVPPIARHPSGNTSTKPPEQGSAVATFAGDDDDDDIDWEDGDDEEDAHQIGIDDTDHEPQSKESHVKAVEATLAAMEASGGLRGGEIEIEFGQGGTDRSDTHVRRQHLHVLPPATATMQPQGSNNQYSSETMEALQKYVRLLNDRHMPRLSAWVEGLTNSDNLTPTLNGSREVSSALVSLGADTVRRRHELLEQLANLKKTVASVLSSAMKLLHGDKATTNTSSELAGNSVRPPPEDGAEEESIRSALTRTSPALGSANLAGASRNTSLLTSFQRQQRRRQGTNLKNASSKNSTNRIQIKYRSS